MATLEEISSSGIAFMGDPHGNFAPARQIPVEAGVRVLVLLGDMDLEIPLEQALEGIAPEIWWIHGNHDADRVHWYDHLFGSALADRWLHGRVVEIAGIRVAGLGGVFRQHIWHPETGITFEQRDRYLRSCDKRNRWRNGLPRKHRASIWWEDYERLFEQRADVLVTHEAPSCHRYGFTVIDELAEAMGVSLIVHGHHHEQYQASVCDGRITVLGVGLAHISRPNGEVLAKPPRMFPRGKRKRE